MLLAISFANDWAFWALNHKVTVDGVNKVICVNSGVTDFDIKIDLYSDWKEWFELQDYAKYLQALRTIGGDDTIDIQKAGDIYFTLNGWTIAVDLTSVKITGTLFSDDFESAYINKDDWVETETKVPVFPALVSSLVTGIDGTAVSTSTATAVRTELTPELSLIDVSISSRASQTSVDSLSGQVSAVDLIARTINTNTILMDAKIDLIEIDVTNILSVVEEILKYHRNRTIIDPIAFTLTVFQNDNITPLRIYDLKDENGVATVTSIFERIPAIGDPFSDEFSAEFD